MLLGGQEGQALIEYALVISLIALVTVTVVESTGVYVASLFTQIASDV